MRIIVRDSEDNSLCAFEAIQAFYDENKGLCIEIFSDDYKTDLIIIPEGCEDHVRSIAASTCLDLGELYFVWDCDEEEGEEQ